MTDYFAVDSIAHHARSVPDKLAVRELPSGRNHTYAEMNERIDRLAGHLNSLDVKPGDRVGFYALNTIDILDIVFAGWRVGAVVLALNFRLSVGELKYIIEDAGPVAIFVDQELDETADKLKSITNVRHWISTDCAGGDSAFEQIIASSEPLVEHHEGKLGDTCMLMYSSGTTGRPKGVMITHAMLQFSAAAGASAVRATKDCVSLASMPLFHIAAMNVSCLPTLFIGGTVIVARAFEPALVLDTVNNEAFGVTHFFAVPAAFNAMRQHEKADKTDYSRLISATSGAETVPPPLVQWWVDHGVCLQEGYGLTETAGQGCLLSHEDVGHKLGSAGKFLIHSRMKIMKDRETEAAPGETGEIWMRGNVITPGYWNRPEANEDAFVGEWFRTGDIGKCDEDGFVYIEDRLKDMYISGGENVYPAEIEGVLYGMDAIREVSVIGIPHDTWGETGCAIVAPKDGVEITLESIVAHCEGQLAKFKQPTKLIMIDALPRNATGKVLKYQLREKFSKADA